MTKKLKIDYASDIHLGYWVTNTVNIIKLQKRTEEFARKLISTSNNRDVLVLAGDFCEYNLQTEWFIDECSRHYKQVIATFGNHDYYLLSTNQRRKYMNSINRVQELIEYYKDHKNVKMVRNETIEIDSFRFGVTPLWYNITSEASRYRYRATSNDSEYILTGHYDNWHSLHQEDMAYYNSLENVDCMITHIPPVDPPNNPHPYSEFYTTTVDELKAPHWICGHQHNRAEYEKAGTQFHMNPIGYEGEIYNKTNNFPKLQTLTLCK